MPEKRGGTTPAPSKKALWPKAFGITAVVVITALMSAILLHLPQKETPTLAELPYDPVEFVSSDPQEVLGASDLPEGSLVLTERSVVAIDAQGNNAYQYAFFMSNFTGEQRFTFAKRDNLQYESMQVIGGEYLVIYDESGSAAKEVFRFDGNDADGMFIPPYQPDAVLFSENGKYLAYSELDTMGVATLAVRSRQDGGEQRFSLADFDVAPESVVTVRPLAFSQDATKLFLQISEDTGSVAVPYRLLTLQISDKTITELFRQDAYTSLNTYQQLVGVYPDIGVALFETLDYGNASPATEKVSVQSTFTALQLENQEKSEWLRAENLASPITTRFPALSPDRQWLALESLDQDYPGIVLWHIQDKKLQKISNSGTFLAWSPDSRFVLTEHLDFEGLGSYSLHSLDLESRKEYRILEQNGLSEGTGLNSLGDTFGLFLGIANDLSTG